MYERRFITPEDKIDRLLAGGDIAAAEAFIDECLRRSSLNDKEFYHLSLKRAALPLFEVAYGTDDPRAYGEANDVYADIGEMLRRELARFSYETYHNIGEISEQTFLALHLGTLIDESTPSVILPASRRKDKKGTDFYFSPTGTGKTDDGYPVQLKTVVTEEDESRYRHVTLIGMSDIDPHGARDPLHPNSLASAVLRQLDGEATSDDLALLESARQKTYDLIRKKHGTRGGVAGALFRAVERLSGLHGETA